jgi:hypothetical protein
MMYLTLTPVDQTIIMVINFKHFLLKGSTLAQGEVYNIMW